MASEQVLAFDQRFLDRRAGPIISDISVALIELVANIWDDCRTWLDTSSQGFDAKALLLRAQIDSQLEFHRVSREVNSSRYEGTDTKTPLINSL